MAVNPYFINYGLNGNNSNEQELINSLVSESIQIKGIDIQFLPRTMVRADSLFHEDIISKFANAITIEAYPESFDGFDGDDLLAQFGMTGKDQVRLMISQSRFKTESGQLRPNEGDLIYFPLSNQLFEIKFVEHEDQFYPGGTLPSFKLRCEAFDYSGEQLNTGIPTIDAVEDDIAIQDVFSNNADIQTEADTILDFSEQNPFGAP